MHADFTWEEWVFLDPSQRVFTMMLLQGPFAIDYSLEDYNIGEHCQNSRRHVRHERSHTAEKPSEYIQCVKPFACYNHLHRYERIHIG